MSSIALKGFFLSLTLIVAIGLQNAFILRQGLGGMFLPYAWRILDVLIGLVMLVIAAGLILQAL